MLRRWRGAWPRRSKWFDPPWAVAAPAEPAYPPSFIRQALRRVFLPRRGAFHEPVWPASTWLPQFRDQTPRGAALPRRGAFHEPPWPQVAAEPSVWRPGIIRATLRLAGRPTRRGAFHEPPWPEGPQTVWRPDWQGQAGTRPKFEPRSRRGRFFQSPPQFTGGSAGGVGVGNRRGLLARRGQFIEPPWPQVVPPPSVWRPQVVRATLRLTGRPIRRGSFHEPPWPQAAQPSTWPPRWLGRRRHPFSGSISRRGEFFWTPPRPAGVPAWLRSRPRPVPSLARRGHFHEPRWVEGPQSVWRPDPVCQSGGRPKWPAHRPRRGRQFAPPWPSVAPPIVNINPEGPEQIGAIISETDALAGATTQPGVLEGTIS